MTYNILNQTIAKYLASQPLFLATWREVAPVDYNDMCLGLL